MTDKRTGDARKTGPDGWMDEMQGDEEARKILNQWKGKRFLKRLQRLCGKKETDPNGEGTRR